MSELHQTDGTMRREDFVSFARDVEPGLRRSLVAGFGVEVGRPAAAHALAVAWQKWPEPLAKRNPRAYVYAIGRNEARRIARTRVRRPRADIGYHEAREPVVEPGLVEAISRLTHRQRVIVLLLHGFDMTMGEVAGFLGLSKSTIQTQERRAMVKLRRNLGVME